MSAEMSECRDGNHGLIAIKSFYESIKYKIYGKSFTLSLNDISIHPHFHSKSQSMFFCTLFKPKYSSIDISPCFSLEFICRSVPYKIPWKKRTQLHQWTV